MALSLNSFESHQFSSQKLVCNRVHCVFGLGGFSFHFSAGRGRAAIKLSFWNSSGPRWLSSSFQGAAGSPHYRFLKQSELLSISFILDLGSNLNYFIKVNILLFYTEIAIRLQCIFRNKGSVLCNF